jgi:transposase-like protein
MTWRLPGTLAHNLPSNVKPVQLVKGIYWYMQEVPLKTVRAQCNLAEKSARALFYHLRMIMTARVFQLQGSLPMLGGPGRVVCIDETFFTKKKRAKGGFQGRYTVGHKTIVLGMTELYLDTRKETGNIRLLIIPDVKKQTLMSKITSHVVPGSLIFTDSLKSYKGLTRAGFVHRYVNHKQREFSRVENLFGADVKVSTNAAEGLFGRLKRWCRARGVKRVSHKAYGWMIGEFLWRHHFGLDGNAVWDLFDHIAEFQQAVLEHPRATWEHGLYKNPQVVDEDLAEWRTANYAAVAVAMGPIDLDGSGDEALPAAAALAAPAAPAAPVAPPSQHPLRRPLSAPEVRAHLQGRRGFDFAQRAFRIAFEEEPVAAEPAPAPAPAPAPTLRPRGRARVELPVSSGRCPRRVCTQGHVLQKKAREPGWTYTCSGCGHLLQGRASVYRCDEDCDFDLCGGCYMIRF